MCYPGIAAALPDLDGHPLDAVLITPLLAKSADVVKALRNDGFQQVLIGGNSFNSPDMATATGGAVEGTYVGAAWNPDEDTNASDFVAADTQRFESAPESSSLRVTARSTSCSTPYSAPNRPAVWPCAMPLRRSKASTRPWAT